MAWTRWRYSLLSGIPRRADGLGSEGTIIFPVLANKYENPPKKRLDRLCFSETIPRNSMYRNPLVVDRVCRHRSMPTRIAVRTDVFDWAKRRSTMRGLCFGAVAFWVLATSVTGRDAEADKEARALLDKAIQVAGGEAKVAKLKAVTLKTKAKIRFGDGETDFSGVCSFVELDRFSIEGEAGGSTLYGVLSPKGAWLKLGARV